MVAGSVWAGRKLNLLLARTGFQISRTRTRPATMDGALAQLASLKLSPRTAIDVGAAAGEWTRLCMRHLPEASYVLIEPLEEFHPALSIFATNPKVDLVHAAAAEASGESEIYVHPDLVGSSLLQETEEDLNQVVRKVQSVALDDLVQERQLPGPFLIKIDAQGSEGRVLQGAKETLRNTEAMIVEVSFLPFFKDGPLILDVLTFLDARGFAPYDLVDPSYRPLDGALAQCDIVFVPKNSPLRQDRRYATPEQRKAQEISLLKKDRQDVEI